MSAAEAIALSVKVGDRIRALVGPNGDPLAAGPSIPELFSEPEEQAEAYRLLSIVKWSRRDKRKSKETK